MRILRITLYVVGVLLLLWIGALVWLWWGASASLDRSLTHTRATAALPMFTEGAGDGLVRIPANGMTFRARIAGFADRGTPPTGNVILLHGFPETSVMWLPLIDAAAAAGYRVVAFDQRGYSPGARPLDRDAYSADQLVGDALAVADAVGFEQFHLVGHDWGSAVGWQIVFAEPQRVRSWTALSIPHIVAFANALQNDDEQRDRSAYMAFFWLPWLPEQMLARNDMAQLRELYAEHPQVEVDEYLAVFREPGALTGALNWYRGGFGGSIAPDLGVTTPTLFIWGNRDPAVGRAAVEGQTQFMKGPFEVLELDTGHWLMATAPDEVVPAVMRHLRSQ